MAQTRSGNKSGEQTIYNVVASIYQLYERIDNDA